MGVKDCQIVLDGPEDSLSTVTGCCKFRRLEHTPRPVSGSCQCGPLHIED